VGVDVVDNPVAELRGPVEAPPVEDGTFDLVLCTQVLEHCDDPVQAVRELRRVTAPGGRVLASTHGVQWYHPSPVDYWRWTHEGLRRLFTTNGDWKEVTIEPSGGTAACLAMLVGAYTEVAFRRMHAKTLARGPVWLLNRTAAALDGRFSLLAEPRPGSLTANFHVVATLAR
jgi:SAM-dependent methyltransferase